MTIDAEWMNIHSHLPHTLNDKKKIKNMKRL